MDDRGRGNPLSAGRRSHDDGAEQASHPADARPRAALDRTGTRRAGGIDPGGRGTAAGLSAAADRLPGHDRAMARRRLDCDRPGARRRGHGRRLRLRTMLELRLRAALPERNAMDRARGQYRGRRFRRTGLRALCGRASRSQPRSDAARARGRRANAPAGFCVEGNSRGRRAATGSGASSRFGSPPRSCSRRRPGTTTRCCC